MTLLEEQLKQKQVSRPIPLNLPNHFSLLPDHPQKDKEDLEEISGELELADEDDKVPYGFTVARYFVIQLLIHLHPGIKSAIPLSPCQWRKCSRFSQSQLQR